MYFFGLFFQNLIYIPSIIVLAVSGMKVYKEIKNIKITGENLKYILLKHTFLAIIVLFLVALATVFEVFLSINFLRFIVPFF